MSYVEPWSAKGWSLDARAASPSAPWVSVRTVGAAECRERVRMGEAMILRAGCLRGVCRGFVAVKRCHAFPPLIPDRCALTAASRVPPVLARPLTAATRGQGDSSRSTLPSTTPTA